MSTKFEADFTMLTLLAFMLILPIGAVMAARDNDWQLIAMFVACIGLDLRIRRVRGSDGQDNQNGKS